MENLRQIEAFVEVGFELGLFLIVMTIAIMQVIAPYSRTVVQKVLLRRLQDPEYLSHLNYFLQKEQVRPILGERYPYLARAMSTHVTLDASYWHRARLLEHIHVGVADNLLMRLIQSVAQATIERPSSDPISYAALTADAHMTDRVGGIAVDEIGASELARSVQNAEGAGRRTEGKVPSELALEATAVRTNLAAAVERKLDEVQVEMAAKWQLTGRLLAFGVGAMSSIYVALASGVIPAPPILSLAALAPVVFVILGGWVSGWLENPRFTPAHSVSAFTSRILSNGPLTALIPVFGLLLGFGLVQTASEGTVSLFVFGALAGLVASVVYDAAKAVSRRR